MFVRDNVLTCYNGSLFKYRFPDPSRLFLVAPSTYILAEIPTILTDMLLHRIHLSSATLHVINLQLYGYRKLYLNLHLKAQAIPQVIPQAIPQAIPLPTVALQAPVVPQWRQRLDDVTILYNTVTDKVNSGLSLSQALAQVNLSKRMFQRRRVIAETYISLPECVKSSLQKANCGGDIESIFLRCRAISKTAKGKSKIREMAINGFYFAFGHLMCNS